MWSVVAHALFSSPVSILLFFPCLYCMQLLCDVLWILGSVFRFRKVFFGWCCEVFWGGAWILGSALNSGKCFGFWKVHLGSGVCFGFFEVFPIHNRPPLVWSAFSSSNFLPVRTPSKSHATPLISNIFSPERLRIHIVIHFFKNILFRSLGRRMWRSTIFGWSVCLKQTDRPCCTIQSHLDELNWGSFPKVRTDRPNHSRTSHFDNEKCFFPRVFVETPSPSCMLFRISLIWLDSFDLK